MITSCLSPSHSKVVLVLLTNFADFDAWEAAQQIVCVEEELEVNARKVVLLIDRLFCLEAGGLDGLLYVHYSNSRVDFYVLPCSGCRHAKPFLCWWALAASSPRKLSKACSAFPRAFRSSQMKLPALTRRSSSSRGCSCSRHPRS